MMESKIIIGGGCFWCTEAIFKELKGVSEVKSGYSGGNTDNPTYQEICSGSTGHAEVIQIMYNPEVISFETLVKIHLTTHDPTTPNRQGADKGSQYRSIVFYNNDAEKSASNKAIAEVQHELDDKIVTEVEAVSAFHEAEATHQEYYENNKEAMYCRAVISPKLNKFRKLYANAIN